MVPALWLSLARKLGTSLAQETLEKGARQILDGIAPGALISERGMRISHV